MIQCCPALYRLPRDTYSNYVVNKVISKLITKFTKILCNENLELYSVSCKSVILINLTYPPLPFIFFLLLFALFCELSLKEITVSIVFFQWANHSQFFCNETILDQLSFHVRVVEVSLEMGILQAVVFPERGALHWGWKVKCMSFSGLVELKIQKYCVKQ